MFTRFVSGLFWLLSFCSLVYSILHFVPFLSSLNKSGGIGKNDDFSGGILKVFLMLMPRNNVPGRPLCLSYMVYMEIRPFS